MACWLRWLVGGHREPRSADGGTLCPHRERSPLHHRRIRHAVAPARRTGRLERADRSPCRRCRRGDRRRSDRRPRATRTPRWCVPPGSPRRGERTRSDRGGCPGGDGDRGPAHKRAPPRPNRATRAPGLRPRRPAHGGHRAVSPRSRRTAGLGRRRRAGLSPEFRLGFGRLPRGRPVLRALGISHYQPLVGGVGAQRTHQAGGVLGSPGEASVARALSRVVGYRAVCRDQREFRGARKRGPH